MAQCFGEAIGKDPIADDIRQSPLKETAMSRKTAFNGSAAGRRRAQRSHLQNPQTLSSDLIHRPTPSRAQIQAKGSTIRLNVLRTHCRLNLWHRIWQREEYKRQIERATIIYQQEFAHQYAQPGNLALPEGNLCAWFAKKKENNGEVTP
jgi:hypothetical protein